MATVVDSARNATSAGERPCLRVSPRVHHDEYCKVAGKAIQPPVVGRPRECVLSVRMTPARVGVWVQDEDGESMPKNWLIVLYSTFIGASIYLPFKSNQASMGVPEISLSPDTSIIYLIRA